MGSQKENGLFRGVQYNQNANSHLKGIRTKAMNKKFSDR